MENDRKYAFVVEGEMALPFTYFAGATGSRFLIALRDEKKILGMKCNKCNKVYIPPRATCERDFEDLTGNWVELKDTGTITGFTVIRQKEPHHPKEPPFVMALVKLDGADTPFVHLVDADPSQVRIGMRVKARFAEERSGSILDIACFRPDPAAGK